MKKLMFAALAAVSMGVMAENDCTPFVPPTVDPTLVYAFKASVKTTKGVTSSLTTIDPGSICEPGSGSVTTTASILRAKDTTAWAGWIYDCTATCDTIKNGSVVAWDSKRKAQINDAAFAWDILGILQGKKVAEGAWTFTGTAQYDSVRAQTIEVRGAGYGVYTAKKGYYTSFCGNFAGKMSASYDLSKKAVNCDPSQYWECTDLTTLVDADTVAFGTWSMKYNASASKKFAANGTLAVPAYVTLTK